MDSDNIVESINDYINQVNNFILHKKNLASKPIKLFRGLPDSGYNYTPSK